MPDAIRYLYRGGQGELVEKKSRFIASICPVRSEQEALAFIERIKKQYWDARHNCSAMVIGDRQELTRCSDDGEPPHTAGRPMLDVLLGENLTNVCVVVTRYFGGTLLGTGGLVRAYQGAVSEGLRNCTIARRMVGVPLNITTDYAGIGRLQYLTANENLPVLHTEYGADVVTRVMVAPEKLPDFLKKLNEATAGQVLVEEEEAVSYILADNQVISL